MYGKLTIGIANIGQRLLLTHTMIASHQSCSYGSSYAKNVIAAGTSTTSLQCWCCSWLSTRLLQLTGPRTTPTHQLPPLQGKKPRDEHRHCRHAMAQQGRCSRRQRRLIVCQLSDHGGHPEACVCAATAATNGLQSRACMERPCWTHSWADCWEHGPSSVVATYRAECGQ